MSGTVLFIQDDDDDVFLTRMICDTVGIVSTEFVANGREAVDLLETLAGRGDALPSLMLVDLNTPVMGGLDFLRWRRGEPRFTAIPAVVLSGSENPQDIAEAYASGASAYLVKPFGVTELETMLAAVKAFWIDHNRRPAG